MTEFKFSCPVCGQHLQGDVNYIGNPITCPNCKNEFTVPNPKVTTSLRLQHEQWVPPPTRAHAAPATIILPPPGESAPVPTARRAPRTSGLAWAALVLSLLGPIGCVPAIICGHLARARIAKDPLLDGRGLALAGLIIGYFFLALIVLGLLSILVYGTWWSRAGET